MLGKLGNCRIKAFKNTRWKKAAALLLVHAALLLGAAFLCTGCGGKRGQNPGAQADPGTEAGKNDGRQAEQGSGSDADGGGSSGSEAGGSPAGENGGQAEKGKKQDTGSGGQGTARPVQELFHVGDILEDGALRIVYMESGVYQEESEYQQPEAGSKYIFLRFCFENTSEDRELSVPLFSFGCYADGFQARSYFGGNMDIASSLSGGRMTTGLLCFQVPEDAKDIEIEYRPQYLSQEILPLSGKVRFLYEGEKDSGFVPPVVTAKTPGAFAVGSTAQTKKERISFLSCEPDDPDSEGLIPKEGCSWYTLSFEIENLQTLVSANDDADLHVSACDFTCYADGASCRTTYFRDDYLSADLNPGRKARGTVTFEVPDGAQTVEAEYSPNDKSSKRIVFTIR